ncbi:CACTA en-spm transposon protein [Cucumis melo var. makuwa]|uniref:CACTA en-spm transposon protein n=1 Tax=Cucumis melo var. makuwa TaxID=1194695 RepID=A0A5A7UKY5_CUCMM|nr:CACTA en-spm transposon protein [Cucumis melo var. makuwa]
METDDMFLQFEDDLDNNIAGGSSSVGDNTGSSSQQTTPTPRRRAQSRLLEFLGLVKFFALARAVLGFRLGAARGFGSGFGVRKQEMERVSDFGFRSHEDEDARSNFGFGSVRRQHRI